MDRIWIVETGEYEGRGIQSVFASKELAENYCAQFQPGEEPSEWLVIDSPPRAVKHHRAEGVFGSRRPGWFDKQWVDVDGGYQARSSWDSNTTYCPIRVDEGRIAWWGSQSDGESVYVEVNGYDSAAVEARFADLWRSVVNGERPPPTVRNG